MHLNCAQCGGEFPVAVESPFARCPFCACHLYLDRATTFRHLGLPATLGRMAALDMVRDSARKSGFFLPGESAVSARVLPFWSVRAESLQETLPAFSPLPFALVPFRLPAAQPSWFRPEDYAGYEVVPPGEESLAWESGGAGGPEIALYSVPFFRVRFGPGPRPAEVWVDAAGGRVFWGDAPAGGEGPAARRFLVVSVGLVAAFALEAALIPGFLPAAGAIAVTGAAAFPWLRASVGQGGRP